MPDGSLREQLIEALVALVEGIAAQELPRPVVIASVTQVIVVAD
jgi:hypothetical protein